MNELNITNNILNKKLEKQPLWKFGIEGLKGQFLIYQHFLSHLLQ